MGSPLPRGRAGAAGLPGERGDWCWRRPCSWERRWVQPGGPVPAQDRGRGHLGPGEERWGAEGSEAKSLTAPLLALGFPRSGVRLPSRWTLRGDSGRSGGQEDSGGSI